jgi:hypothetical protein
MPEFKVEEFAIIFKSWWESLQPAWRLLDTWPPSRDVPPSEDWQILHREGINGWFIILMCLSWWVPKAISQKQRTVFESVKADVGWVIKKVLGSLATKD